MPKKDGKASDGLPIPKPPGEATTEDAKSRYYRNLRKRLQSNIAKTRVTRLVVSSYADLALKIRNELTKEYDKSMGPIRTFRASLTVEELNAIQDAEFRSEEELEKHLKSVSCVMENDQENPIVDYSLRVEDSDAKVLFQYFGYQADLSTSYVGIPRRFTQHLAADMQAMMSMFPPGKRSHVGDTRHNDAGAKHFFEVETLVTSGSKHDETDGNGDIAMSLEDGSNYEVGLKTVCEGNGVVHLCQAWPPQGQWDVKPSHDFLGAGAAYRFQAGHCFMAQSYDIQLGVTMRLQAVDPEMYEEMMKSFIAGRYTHVMPGPYLGMACLYKLPVALHKDRHDFGLSGMMNAGDYVGGVLHVPQLGLKLRYRPGDVVFLRAMDLWHEVREWMAMVKPLDSDETEANPGRVSVVFFTHRVAHEILKDKEPNWLMKTFNQNSYRPKKAKS